MFPAYGCHEIPSFFHCQKPLVVKPGGHPRYQLWNLQVNGFHVLLLILLGVPLLKGEAAELLKILIS